MTQRVCVPLGLDKIICHSDAVVKTHSFVNRLLRESKIKLHYMYALSTFV